MAQNILLIIDTTVSGGRLVPTLNSAQTLPPTSIPFYFGDTVNLKVYLLERNPTANVSNTFPFQIVPTTGLTLELFIDDGIAGTSNIYTNQITFTPDSGGQFWTASLSLNTPALQTLLTGKTESTAYLQIGYFQGGLPTTVFSQPINIKAGIPSTAPAVPAGQTALTAEVASTTYLSLTPVNGRPLVLAADDGGTITIYVKRQADGSLTLQEEASG